jgi:hypothetical protein
LQSPDCACICGQGENERVEFFAPTRGAPGNWQKTESE